jgi:hypothetical protein
VILSTGTFVGTKAETQKKEAIGISR